MNEMKKIAHNTLIQVLGKALTISFALVGFGLITRYLGQEGFGYFTTVYAFLTIFGILVDLGLQMTTIKLISDPNNNEGQILSNALTIRLILSVISAFKLRPSLRRITTTPRNDVLTPFSKAGHKSFGSTKTSLVSTAPGSCNKRVTVRSSSNLNFRVNVLENFK